jgi:phosphate-selective porin
VLALLSAFAISSRADAQATWGGYVQTRFATDYRSSLGFSIRRAKLYTAAVAPFDTNLSARMQAIFRWQNAGTLTLQDVYAEYRLPFISFRAGQFVPEFCLQRLQPDAAMPVVERALVVDALIPSAETYARDIGVRIMLHPSGPWGFSLGMFNGNGGNQAGNNDWRFLYVARPTFDVMPLDSVHVHGGLSLAYRNKTGLTFKKIFGITVPFTGDDFRWGAEWLLSSTRWRLQGEYLQANLRAEKAWGYYIIANVLLDPTNEIVGLVERFNDLDTTTPDATWYGMGWNHYFAENQFKVQCAARTQFVSGHNQYATTIQLQTFIH